jgi:AcrR family transcriptional regulator
MSGKREEKRAALREALVDAAERQIAEGGLSALRARDLAREAGCALGAIYTHFEDLNALVLAVNMRSFARLGAAAAAADALPAEGPKAQMLSLARAYLGFAVQNRQLWHAMFDFQFSQPGQAPAWYADALDGLFGFIITPLEVLYPQEDADKIALRSRALFSAVHGIVLMSLENRFATVPQERILEMIELMLDGVAWTGPA